MGAGNSNLWPNCGCAERCGKPKCLHAGGALLQRQSLEKHGFSDVGRKNSPERMRVLLKKLIEFPNVTKAASFAGIAYTTLSYWLKKSSTGHPGDGFDLEFGEETKRFHEHYEDAHQAGIQMVEDAYVERALSGYYETLHHQGRVAYQYDQELIDLGFSGTEAYLRDEHGKPIPERIQHQDPEVMLSVLKAWRRDRYGQHDKLDVNVHGGVMVVTAPAMSSADLEAREARMKLRPVDVEFREVAEDE